MSVLGSLGFGSEVSIATTRVGLKPSCTLNKSQKLRSRRPAATISTRESANSPITRTWRKRERRREPLAPRPSCRSVAVKSRRLVSQAGASPKMVPAATETTMANASTPQPDGNVIEAREAFGNKLQQEFPGAEEHRETGDAAQHEEQQALGEKLTNQAHSCGSQCLANRHLASARAGASKQQIGDVDAADQQDQAHRAEQQNERLANVADESLGQGSEVDCPGALRRIIRRILLFQRCNQGIEAPLRGLRRETRLKARDGLEGETRCRAKAAGRGRRKIRTTPTNRCRAPRWFGPGRESRRA